MGIITEILSLGLAVELVIVTGCVLIGFVGLLMVVVMLYE